MDKNDIYIRFLEYGVEKDNFTLNELKQYLKLSDIEFKLVDNEVNGADTVARSNHYRPEESTNAHDEILQLSFRTKSDYFDFLELKAARKASREAKFLATFAIIISILAILVPIFSTQKVSIVETEQEVLSTIDANTDENTTTSK